MPALYIADPALHINLASEHLEIRERLESGEPGALKRRIPLFDVERVAIVKGPHVSGSVLHKLLRRDIPVSLIGRHGGLIGCFLPARDGDANVRIRQYEACRNEGWRLKNAKALIRAKLLNCRRVLQKASADKAVGDAEALERSIEQLRSLAGRVDRAMDCDSLRGLEGAGSAAYFRELGKFFPAQMPFARRSRRPPLDEANALLSWTYTLVMSEIKTAVASVGLDPCIGCLHAIGYGRPSLALDLLEPLRGPLCDMLVLRLTNLKIMKPEDFRQREEDGGYAMKKEAMKTFFIQYEQRMERMFKDAVTGEHTTFRRKIAGMACDYASALRSGRAMEPFVMP